MTPRDEQITAEGSTTPVTFRFDRYDLVDRHY